MAVPRVFVSSTCYDLKYIRENIRYFINNMGFESILSENGDVFYDPEQHTHDACLTEVQNCQMFVLIIGGRYGGNYRQEDKSITNKEYEEAVKNHIPVFALVDRNVWSEHFVYQKNSKNKNADSIIYPNVDNIKIFEFINEVRKSENNNAIYAFGDFQDIEQYLKKQWAGLLYNFLTNSIETKKVKDLFEEIHSATEKIEYYTKQVALNVGDARTNVLIQCYDIMLGNEIVQEVKGCWGIDLSPQILIREESLDALCDNNIVIEQSENNSITLGGPPYRCSKIRYEQLKRQHKELRDILLNLLEKENILVDDFLNIK